MIQRVEDVDNSNSHNTSPSNDFFLADGTFLLALEPLVDAFRMVSVAALLQFLHIFESLEVLEADCALFRLALRVLFLAPNLRLDRANLRRSESAGHIAAIRLLEREQLLVRHLLSVWLLLDAGIATTFLDGTLQHFVFALSCNSVGLLGSCGYHVAHHDLHEKIAVALPSLGRLTLAAEPATSDATDPDSLSLIITLVPAIVRILTLFRSLLLLAWLHGSDMSNFLLIFFVLHLILNIELSLKHLDESRLPAILTPQLINVE